MVSLIIIIIVVNLTIKNLITELFSMKLLCEKPIMRAFLKNKVPLLKEEKQKVQKNEVDDGKILLFANFLVL
jgi:hypothetical protein